MVIPYKNTRMGSKTPGVYVICFLESIYDILECPKSKIGRYMNLALSPIQNQTHKKLLET